MSPRIKDKLSRFRAGFFREKYRFDQGDAFLVFLNFALLVVSLVHQGNGPESMIWWFVLIGFTGTWLLGYFLDKVVRVQDAVERVSLKRSPIWQENFQHHGDLDQKIELISEKIDRLEEIIKLQNKT